MDDLCVTFGLPIFLFLGDGDGASMLSNVVNKNLGGPPCLFIISRFLCFFAILCAHKCLNVHK